MLDDVFTPSPNDPSTVPTEGAATIQADMRSIVQTDPAVVDAQFALLNRRRAADRRVTLARRDAVVARAIAQAFSEHARTFHRAAEAKGSEVDYKVAKFLAATCDNQVAQYSLMQARLTAEADSAGI